MTRYRQNLEAGEYDRLAEDDKEGRDFQQFGATGKGPEDSRGQKAFAAKKAAASKPAGGGDGKGSEKS